MNHTYRLLTIPIAIVMLSACDEDPVGPLSIPCDQFLTSYSSITADTVTTTEGLQYVDVELGTGVPAAGVSSVLLNYSLYHSNGELIESSCSEATPVFIFTLGQGQVIEGFELGVTGMKPGGVRRLIVPVELGYDTGELAGEQLIFDVEFIAYQ